ncbi:MAG: hypothetical protein ACRDUA_20250, partial [Micromonosporaceae bacterium]
MTRRREPTGTPARWRQRGRWRYGRLADDARRQRDGSLLVWDDYNGGARCLAPTRVQHETRGPRGGRHWDWIAAPSGPPAPALPPAWKRVEGRCELFNQLPLWGQLP